MMNRIDSSWVLLPVVFDCFCCATLVATAPARWNWMPGGAPTFVNAEVSPLTTSCEDPGLYPAMFASTRSCTARPFCEVPTYCTASTFGTFLAAMPRRVIAWVSAAVIGPCWLTPMMMTGTSVALPTSGSARLPATALGALEGRNAELLLLTWLPSDGRK